MRLILYRCLIGFSFFLGSFGCFFYRPWAFCVYFLYTPFGFQPFSMNSCLTKKSDRSFTSLLYQVRMFGSDFHFSWSGLDDVPCIEETFSIGILTLGKRI